MNQGWLGLEGARVLVGGAGGIGAACADAFAEHGASVLVIDRDADRLAALGKRTGQPPLHVRVTDLTAKGSGADAVAEAVRALGGLDVVVHCIGINERRPVLQAAERDWQAILDVNLGTAFRLAQAAGRHMVAQQAGRIVLLSSVSGLVAHRNHAPYAASKGGLNQMMRAMAREWASAGVTVNAVAPGYVETNLTAGYLAAPGVREGLVDLIPAGRLGTTQEVASSVLFLASRQASFITGHVLYVDGGRTLV